MPIEREIDATPDAFALASVKLKSRVSAVGGRQRRCAVPVQRRPGGREEWEGGRGPRT
ncbi:hypothetical protein [Burkholderia territorii]|uniref:hypothetical protein n=1 Tax=Burkholderia territorii TaxID=1503055 RepID=UPI000AF2E47E|nr:hypothetical protein [Burkholderia territorii]